jgi:hypothetical protein
MPYDRELFFDSVRKSLFGGSLSTQQVGGTEYLFDVWEEIFEEKYPEDQRYWFAYCLATVFHETAQKMVPLEEYGKGEGHSYGEPAGDYGNCYYGRGHVQLTWADNYAKGEQFLAERYGLNVPMYQYPHRMLEDETSALVLYDGMIHGWFTGVGLPQFFDARAGVEDPYNARKIVNALDQASKIADYYEKMKKALQPI